MISKDKEYKTRSGLPVRIYAIDGAEDDPIHGSYFEYEGWHSCIWKKNGQYFGGAQDELDLIEVKPKRKVTIYVYNMYSVVKNEVEGSVKHELEFKEVKASSQEMLGNSFVRYELIDIITKEYEV